MDNILIITVAIMRQITAKAISIFTTKKAIIRLQQTLSIYHIRLLNLISYVLDIGIKILHPHKANVKEYDT